MTDVPEASPTGKRRSSPPENHLSKVLSDGGSSEAVPDAKRLRRDAGQKPWMEPLSSAEECELTRFLSTEYQPSPGSPRRVIHFCEIGTSNYNTISHAVFPLADGSFSSCSTGNYHYYKKWHRWMREPAENIYGLAVDVIPWVLQELPQHSNLNLANVAMVGVPRGRDVHEASPAEEDRRGEQPGSLPTGKTEKAPQCSATDHEASYVVALEKYSKPATVYFVPKDKIVELEKSWRTGCACSLHQRAKCWTCYHTGQLATACASVNQRPSYFYGRLQRLGIVDAESSKTVPAVSYTQLLAVYNVQRPELLQLDCEGLDFDIMRSVRRHCLTYGPEARPKQIVFEGTSGRRYVEEATELIRQFLQLGYVLEFDPFYDGDDEVEDEEKTGVRNISLILDGLTVSQ
ncbi:unnamed protein product [Amoebophrya sp. A120]|nr:unnamed protein product [Amoebophrya sp. A120]|eukprot:GSA120T00017907001.1